MCLDVSRCRGDGGISRRAKHPPWWPMPPCSTHTRFSTTAVGHWEGGLVCLDVRDNPPPTRRVSRRANAPPKGSHAKASWVRRKSSSPTAAAAASTSHPAAARAVTKDVPVPDENGDGEAAPHLSVWKEEDGKDVAKGLPKPFVPEKVPYWSPVVHGELYKASPPLSGEAPSGTLSRAGGMAPSAEEGAKRGRCPLFVLLPSCPEAGQTFLPLTLCRAVVSRPLSPSPLPSLPFPPQVVCKRSVLK